MKIKFAILLMALLRFTSCTPCHAADVSTHVCKVTDADAIHAIMGESAGEPYQGKLWVASIIRNRNSLNGIYGFKVSQKWLDAQPKRVHDDAAKAWSESALHDVSDGCNMFGGKIDDAYFAKLKLKPVKTIGNQRFYKSK